MREAFVAPPGHRIVSADYSQIELRILAHLSGDAACSTAFAAGEDIHRATAAEVFGVAPGEVTREQRRYAKTINFGLIYGMGAFGLAQALGIERRRRATYIDRYFARFAGVKRYMDETKARAAELGLRGDAVRPPHRAARDPRPAAARARSGAERQAINAPMQGTAADLIKLAMIAVQAALDARAARTTHGHAGARRTGVRGARGRARLGARPRCRA